MKTVREWELAVERLVGRPVPNGVNLDQVIRGFERMGIYYVARDTHSVATNSNKTITLIYHCAHSDCPSFMKFTVTNATITRLEHNWCHRHSVYNPEKPHQVCSVCHRPGHNKTTCPITKGKGQVQFYFRNREDDQLISVLDDVKATGWRILGIGAGDMKKLVSLIDLTDPERVRRFFYFAPNDCIGVTGKEQLYANVFKSYGRRRPSIDKDKAFLLRCQRSHGQVAAMVYALIWYTHLVAVTENRWELFSEVKKTFKERLKVTASIRNEGCFDWDVHLPKAALQEGILKFRAAKDLKGSIQKGILHVDRKNADDIAQSLVPNFLTSVYFHPGIERLPDHILQASWCLEEIIIESPELAASCPFGELITTRVLHSYKESEA